MSSETVVEKVIPPTEEQVREYFLTKGVKGSGVRGDKEEVCWGSNNVYGEGDYTFGITVGSKDVMDLQIPWVNVSCFQRELLVPIPHDYYLDVDVDYLSDGLSKLVGDAEKVRSDLIRVVELAGEHGLKNSVSFSPVYTNSAVHKDTHIACGINYSMLVSKGILDLEEDIGKILSFYEAVKGEEIKMSGIKPITSSPTTDK